MKKNNKKEIDLAELVQTGGATIIDYFDLGAIYLILGHYDKLFAIYNKLKTKHLSNIDLAHVYHEEGEVFLRRGNGDEAMFLFAKSLSLLSSCDDSFDCLFWKGLNHYNLFLLEDDQDLGRSHATAALKYFKSLINNFNVKDDFKIYSAIADIYSRIEDFDNAINSYNTALHLTRNNNDKIWILFGIASSYSKQGECNEAIKYFKKALQLSANDIPTSNIYYEMGLMYFANNRLAEANEAFQEALRIKDEDVSLKENHEYENDILWHLGIIAYNAQDSQNVSKHLNKLLSKIGNNHYYYANTHLTLGHYYLSDKKYEKAIEHYNLVLKAPQAQNEEIKIAKDYLAKLPLNG